VGRSHRLGSAERPEKLARPGTLRRIATYFRPYKAKVGLVIFLVVLTSVLGVVNPLLIKFVTSEIIYIAQAPTEAVRTGHFENLAKLVGLMVVIPIITGLVGVAQTYFNNLVGQSVMRDLRNALYRHLQAMSMRFFSTTRTGEIQSRVGNDVGGIQDVITNTASGTLANVAIVASTVPVMVYLSWQLTILTFVLIPLFMLYTYRVGKSRREVSKATQMSLANISSLVEENLSVSGILLTKTFGRQQQSIDRFTKENQKLANLELHQQMVGRWFFMGIGTFFSVLPALVYFVAGWLETRSVLGTGGIGLLPTVVAYTTLQTRVFFPIGQLLQVQVQYQGALALFDRIFEYLDMPIEIQSPVNPTPLDLAQARGDVEFENVSFVYDEEAGRKAVDGANFEALPGQLVALVGPSGAGKTTMTYLASRLYDVTDGTVRIDGVDIRKLKLETVADLIGMVTQETFLFHSSIRDNLLFAKTDATHMELDAAVRAANLGDKMAELPDGLDTIVGERGYRLSGGEKQRLAIARVFLKDPRILILDEATSALDTHSERLIQAALEPLTVGRTTIAIAHRLSTILRADQILVIQAGRIVERGTHASLLLHGGAYAQLYHEQFADGRIEAECIDGSIEAAN
jgi:ATP-binding cassette subfamily B protein